MKKILNFVKVNWALLLLLFVAAIVLYDQNEKHGWVELPWNKDDNIDDSQFTNPNNENTGIAGEAAFISEDTALENGAVYA